MLTTNIRSFPQVRVQRLYQRLFDLVTRLQSNGGKKNIKLGCDVREFFIDHRDEIRSSLDVFNELSPELKDLTAKAGMVNPMWRSWATDIESAFSQALSDSEVDENLKNIEIALDIVDVQVGPHISLFPGGYESIERALRYAAYWTPDD